MSGEPRSRQEDAEDYLTDHRLEEFFANLTAALVYQRPENLREFMINYIQSLKDSREEEATDAPNLFDETNIRAMFGMFDVTNRGYITRNQYVEAFKNFGVASFNKQPSGSDVDKITLDTFLREMKNGLSKLCATYSLHSM